MKKLCYVCPTIIMKRPIKELFLLLRNKYNVNLFVPGYDYTYWQIGKTSDWTIPKFTIFKRVWRMLKNNDIIHVWVPFYLSNTIIALMKGIFFRQKKLILTMDTVPPYSFSMGWKMDLFLKIYYKTLGKIVFNCCDYVTLYDKTFIPYALKAGVPKKKIRITPTGINLKDKKTIDKDIRKEFGILKKDKVILFIGLLVPRKGIDEILDIAKYYLMNDKFIIVGESPSKDLDYKKKAKQMKLKNVIFTGARTDVHNFYQQCDLFMFPSKGEGFAGVLMEARKYGIPICTSNIVGSNELMAKPLKELDWKNNLKHWVRLYK